MNFWISICTMIIGGISAGNVLADVTASQAVASSVRDKEITSRSQTVAARSIRLCPPKGDLVTTVVEPRHIKLGLAGKQQNWTYSSMSSVSRAMRLPGLHARFPNISQSIPLH